MSEQQILNSIYSHPIALFLPSILFSLLIYKLFFTKLTKPKNLPPSPSKLPILGHIHKLGMLPHIQLGSMSKQYGEIMLIYLGNSPAVIISSSKMAKEITKNHDPAISSRPESTVLDKLFYNRTDVASAPYGEHWRKMRSIFMLQLLSNKRVKSYRSVREEETALLMKKIEQNCAFPVNLSSMFLILSNDLTCRVAFGRKYNQQSVDFEDALREFMELIGVFHVGDFIPCLAWVDRINGLNDRLDRVSKQFDEIFERILREHEQKNLGFVKNENEAKDFVDVLLEIQKENSDGFTLERDGIKSMILDTFLAGTETSSTILEWTMTELLKNGGAMEQVQKEVRGIGEGKAELKEEDLEEMKYLKAVIKETFRLHPAIPLLVPRLSTQDIKVNGYDIPAKSRVIFNAWAIHRDPLTWKDSEEFRPERFLNSSIDFKGQDFELIPFGTGRRVCPGISFATVNIQLVLANLLNKFKWKLPHGIDENTLDMSQCPGIAIRRKVPLLAIATPHL